MIEVSSESTNFGFGGTEGYPEALSHVIGLQSDQPTAFQAQYQNLKNTPFG